LWADRTRGDGHVDREQSARIQKNKKTYGQIRKLYIIIRGEPSVKRVNAPAAKHVA